MRETRKLYINKVHRSDGTQRQYREYQERQIGNTDLVTQEIREEMIGDREFIDYVLYNNGGSSDVKVIDQYNIVYWHWTIWKLSKRIDLNECIIQDRNLYQLPNTGITELYIRTDSLVDYNTLINFSNINSIFGIQGLNQNNPLSITDTIGVREEYMRNRKLYLGILITLSDRNPLSMGSIGFHLWSKEQIQQCPVNLTNEELEMNFKNKARKRNALVAYNSLTQSRSNNFIELASYALFNDIITLVNKNTEESRAIIEKWSISQFYDYRSIENYFITNAITPKQFISGMKKYKQEGIEALKVLPSNPQAVGQEQPTRGGQPI